MRLTWDKVVAAIIMAASFLFGDWSVALQVLLIFMALDVVTGMVRAFLQKEASSKEGWKGFLRKSLVLVVLIVAHQLDRIAGTGSSVRNMVVFFYCTNEGLSILENVAAMGVPLPEFLTNALKLLNDKKYPDTG